MIVVCVIERETPIRQIMSELPLARLAAPKSPFTIPWWIILAL